MKRFLFPLLLLGVTAVSSAQRYDYLTLRTLDGSERSFPVDGLKFTLSDGRLTATDGGSPITYSLTELRDLRFTATPTGITAADNEASVAIRGGRLIVNAPAGTRISVYTPDGRAARPDALAPGIYLVTVGQRTLKLLSR